MTALYSALDQGKVGIFESPTGTGKSLSLICGALSWLVDHEEKKRQEAAALLQEGEASLSTSAAPSSSSSSASAEPDWITDFVQKKAERDLVSKLKVEEVRLAAFIYLFFMLLNIIEAFFQEEELKRKKREERMEMIRNNINLKYASKRKVRLFGEPHVQTPSFHISYR